MRPDGTAQDSDYTFSSEPTRVDLARVHRWLSDESYWAKGRSWEDVHRSVENSLPYCAFAGSTQVGFARAVTDEVTFAWICDVFVDQAHRGLGLGQQLVEFVVNDLTEKGVPRLVLATRDAHEVYRRAGFEELEGAGRWMEIDRRPQRAAIAGFS